MPTKKQKYTVCLEIWYQRYDRYSPGGICQGRAYANDTKQALLALIDEINVYIDSETIEKMEEEKGGELTVDEIIDILDSTNGDGCDLIIKLWDTISEKVYISDAGWSSWTIFVC